MKRQRVVTAIVAVFLALFLCLAQRGRVATSILQHVPLPGFLQRRESLGQYPLRVSGSCALRLSLRAVGLAKSGEVISQGDVNELGEFSFVVRVQGGRSGLLLRGDARPYEIVGIDKGRGLIPLRGLEETLGTRIVTAKQFGEGIQIDIVEGMPVEVRLRSLPNDD